MEEELSLTGMANSVLCSSSRSYALSFFLRYFQLSTVNFRLSSVLSLEDKIRERRQGARILGVGAAIEARLGAAGIILCKRAGAIERAGFVDERNDRFGPHGIKFLFG